MYFRRSRFQSFAKDMLESVGLTAYVEKFFMDSRVKGMIKNAYLKLEVKVNTFVAKLPENHKKEIDVEGMEALFTKEVRYDFEKSLGLSLRVGQSRGEITENFIKELKTGLTNISLDVERRLTTSLNNVERDLTGQCEFIVERYVGRFGRDYDCDDYDDDDDDCDIYD